MEIRCPDCGRRIGRRGIAADSGRATCGHCGKVAPRHAEAGATRVVDPGGTPRGAWFSDDGVEVRVGASTRSLGRAIFQLPIGVLFCGIAGLFGAFSVTSILQGLGVMSSASGRAGSPGAGACVMLFALPILGVGVWMLWSAAMAIGGRVEVTLRGGDVLVFTGIGPLGRRQRLSAASITGVMDFEEVIKTSRSSIRRRVVLLEVPGTEGVKFGAALSQKRREFVIERLQLVLGR